MAVTNAAQAAETMSEKKQTKSSKKRGARAKAHAARGAIILADAVKAGYKPNPKLRFSGKGDYRSRTRMAGKGDFVGDVANAGGSLVSDGINWLGSKAKRWLGSLFGAGDYKSHADVPTANSLWNGSAAPEIVSTNGRSFIVRHREFVTELASSTSFTLRDIALNPGLPSSFPWLNAIANGFARWRFNGAIVEFVSSVSPQGANSSGEVCMCTLYDTSAPAPSTIVEMSNAAYAMLGRPMDNMLMAIECAPDMNPMKLLNVRNGSLPSSVDQQLFDWGRLYLATNGQATAGTVIGRVYISYEVQFDYPVDTDRSYGSALTDHVQITGPTNAAYFGSTSGSRVTVPGSNILGTMTNNTYTFPSWVDAGVFRITYSVSGTTAAVVADPTFTLSGCSLVQIFSTQAGFDLATTRAVTGVSNTLYNVDMYVKVTSPAPSFTFSAGTVPTGTTFADLFISVWSGDVLTLSRSKRRFHDHWKAQDEEKQTLSQMIRAALKERYIRDEDEKEEYYLPPPPSLIRSRAPGPEDDTSSVRSFRR